MVSKGRYLIVETFKDGHVSADIEENMSQSDIDGHIKMEVALAHEYEVSKIQLYVFDVTNNSYIPVRTWEIEILFNG